MKTHSNATFCMLMIMSFFLLETLPSSAEANPRRRISSFGTQKPEDPMAGAKKELMTGMSTGTYIVNSNASEIRAIAALNFPMSPQLQLGGEGGLIINNYSGYSTTTSQLFVIGTFNFNTRINHSFFLKGGFGFSNTSSSSQGSSSNRSGFLAGMGQRIYLWPYLCYTPELRITQYEGTSITEFKALNFSIFF